VLSASRAQAVADASADDERFMRLAIEEARLGDFPFGAVIVRDGEVIARGRNLGKTDGDPTAHGEMVAIRRCLAEHGQAALVGSTLYTSGEPCVMCLGAIIWCHMGRMVDTVTIPHCLLKRNHPRRVPSTTPRGVRPRQHHVAERPTQRARAAPAAGSASAAF
jgi:pyrimidine deaminase RibD-like protein